MTTGSGRAVLTKFSDTGRSVTCKDEDIRGRRVLDSAVQDAGRVADLLIDDQQLRLRFRLVEQSFVTRHRRTEERATASPA